MATRSSPDAQRALEGTSQDRGQAAKERGSWEVCGGLCTVGQVWRASQTPEHTQPLPSPSPHSSVSVWCAPSFQLVLYRHRESVTLAMWTREATSRAEETPCCVLPASPAATLNHLQLCWGFGVTGRFPVRASDVPTGPSSILLGPSL